MIGLLKKKPLRLSYNRRQEMILEALGVLGVLVELYFVLWLVG